MLETIAIILIVLWLLGMVSSYTVGGFIHVLLVVAIVMLLFIIASAWHMKIGMQVVIEDYVHNEKLKLVSIMLNNFFSVAVALASTYAILKLSSGV